MIEGKKSLGDFLVDRGIIHPDQLKKAYQEQKRGGERLEQTLVRLEAAQEAQVLQGLADYFSLPFIDLNTYSIDEKVIRIIPEEMARRHSLMPLFKIGNTLTVAMVNPLNIFGVDEVRNKTKCDVEIAINTTEKIKKAILASCERGVKRVGGHAVRSTETMDGYKFRIDGGWLLIRSNIGVIRYICLPRT